MRLACALGDFATTQAAHNADSRGRWRDAFDERRAFAVLQRRVGFCAALGLTESDVFLFPSVVRCGAVSAHAAQVRRRQARRAEPPALEAWMRDVYLVARRRGRWTGRVPVEPRELFPRTR